jgi:hypothetical protein
MAHPPYKLVAQVAQARAARITRWMKGPLRKYYHLAFGNRAEKRLITALEKLPLYCQAPDPKAESATDLHEAMKQWTWWPQEDSLGQIKDSVLTLARTERRNPERRPWEMFELVDRRKSKLRLVERVNDLVGHAKDRFIEANFSDLEALSWERDKDKSAQNLLRDIDRIKEDVAAARTIDWAQYKDILSKVLDEECLLNVSGNDVALACYARVLELIVGHRKWGKIRKDSEALVYWLLEIGYPGMSDRNGLEQFNRAASFRWIWERARRLQQKRESKLEKLRQSGIQIEWDQESKEDAGLMELIAKGDLEALATLRQRYWRIVTAITARVMGNNQDAEEIALTVFDKVRKAAPEYVPTPWFKTWLSTIARRTAIDELRRTKAKFVGLGVIEPDDREDWSWQPPEQ